MREECLKGLESMAASLPQSKQSQFWEKVCGSAAKACAELQVETKRLLPLGAEKFSREQLQDTLWKTVELRLANWRREQRFPPNRGESKLKENVLKQQVFQQAYSEASSAVKQLLLQIAVEWDLDISRILRHSIGTSGQARAWDDDDGNEEDDEDDNPWRPPSRW